IHLQDGMIRCHWNDEPWSYNMNTPLSITSKEIGKWIHLAMSVHPDGVDLYYNGMKYTVAHAMNKSKVVSSFMLGQNHVGDTWFSGAFDQVSLWNRSLSQEEIIKYMHERALLNASGLVSYITMDETDENGRLCDSFSGAPIREIEFVTHNALSVVPFNPIGRIANNTGTGVISMEFSGTARPGYITTFSGMPYNYLNRDYQMYVPLNKEYYTLHYHTHTTENSTNPILLHYRHGSVVAGDEIALGIRRLGAVEPFEIYALSVASADGAVSFNVPASCLSYSSELMFFSSPASALRPANIELSFGEGIENGSLYTLSEEESEIPVLATVVSGSAEARVALVVKETQYARLDHEEIDMEKARNTFKIVIDRKKLDKLALNPVTVNLVGAESEELVLNVCFEPKVELKLKNGIDESNFVATSAISTLDIEAELLEGYLDADVRLEVLSDMDMAMNTANGSLLLNKPVTIRGMKYYPSGNAPLDAGWNLIGNPYLSNINLTKWQNVEYDAESVTRFVYHTVSGTDNIIAFDMTDYDDEQQIMPFQPYFVQVLKDDARFTVTQIAKEKTLNRRTFDYYTAQELKAVQLRLYCDDAETDRTTVRWEADADTEFVLNEDAPKFWSHSDAANELYTVAADDTELSINLVPEETKAVSVGLTVNTPGTMRLQVARFTGFDKEDNVYLVDKDTGNKILLTQGGESYEFTVADAGKLNGRFELQCESFTGIDNVQQESGYRVYTGQQTCTVTGLQGNAQISIYAASGMLMMRHQVYTADFTTGIRPGVYIVRIRENNKEYVTKIVVK
ncbi:MAG: T9SS type A sorting domain-containing protein, partial [Coprobacter sp.]|nr:T9SS type A sorting domain-containing protein [Coprobacter sp.]